MGGTPRSDGSLRLDPPWFPSGYPAAGLRITARDRARTPPRRRRGRGVGGSPVLRDRSARPRRLGRRRNCGNRRSRLRRGRARRGVAVAARVRRVTRELHVHLKLLRAARRPRLPLDLGRTRRSRIGRLCLVLGCEEGRDRRRIEPPGLKRQKREEKRPAEDLTDKLHAASLG